MVLPASSIVQLQTPNTFVKQGQPPLTSANSIISQTSFQRANFGKWFKVFEVIEFIYKTKTLKRYIASRYNSNKLQSTANSEQ